MPTARFALCLVLPLAACTVDLVPTRPLAGPTPDLVLVLPPRNETGVPQFDAAPLALGADRALRERGYRVLPLDIGRDLLRQSGADPWQLDADGLARIRAHAAVDAVLAIAVRRWTPDGEPLQSSDWQLSWTLRSTRNGNVIWTYDDAGSWRRPAAPLADPTRPPDGERPVQPFGSTAPQSFASARELIEALQRKAMQRLPRGGA